MAVSYDKGDQWDIHPKKKKEVGERLAANAFKIVYGFKNEIAKAIQ
jgi:sialate O-acetylesterase